MIYAIGTWYHHIEPILFLAAMAGWVIDSWTLRLRRHHAS